MVSETGPKSGQQPDSYGNSSESVRISRTKSRRRAFALAKYRSTFLTNQHPSARLLKTKHDVQLTPNHDFGNCASPGSKLFVT